MIKKDKPELNVLPVRTKVVLVPAAIPLLLAGTELIISALFGEAKMPIPAPINERGNKVSLNDTLVPISVSIKNPIEEINKPMGDRILDPFSYLSDAHPLIGPQIDNATETGSKYMPAASGLNFIKGPCK